MSGRQYHIATSADAAYFVPAYVMLLSLFTTNAGHRFSVYLLSDGSLPGQQRQQLQLLCSRFGNALHIMDVDGHTTEGFPATGYISLAAYYRIFLATRLPADVGRVVYFDADLIVNADIAPLMNADLHGQALGAVKECIPYQIERLSIPAGGDYFNSGVLVFDLDIWRKHRYVEQLVSGIAANPGRYLMHDQDALNELLHDKVHYLDGRWNQQSPFFSISKKQLSKRYDQDSDLLLRAPYIVHFLGHIKPWHYMSTHPLKHLFMTYLRQTPFLSFAERPNLKTMSTKIILRARHKIVRIARRIEYL